MSISDFGSRSLNFGMGDGSRVLSLDLYNGAKRQLCLTGWLVSNFCGAPTHSRLCDFGLTKCSRRFHRSR
jgi:hypothetical protein